MCSQCNPEDTFTKTTAFKKELSVQNIVDLTRLVNKYKFGRNYKGPSCIMTLHVSSFIVFHVVLEE